MALYKVHYKGVYFVEADSIDEAMETDREDYEVKWECWENTDAERWDEE